MCAPFHIPDILTQNVQGGVIIFPDVLDNPEVLDKISQATANFGANNKDPKAAIISSYNYLLGQVSSFSVSLKSNSFS